MAALGVAQCPACEPLRIGTFASLEHSIIFLSPVLGQSM